MKNETMKSNQVTIDFLHQASGNQGSATMFEFSVPAGARVPVTYYHEHFDETTYGLERVITFTVQARAIDITSGETIFIPRDAIQGAKN